MRSIHEIMYWRHNMLKTNKSQSTNSIKYTQTIFEQHIFQYSTKHTIQEIKVLKHENLWENKKTHTLFLNIGEEMLKKMEDFGVNTVSLWGRGMDKTMNSHKMRGKIEKFLKTDLKITFIVQNTRFSRLEWVANKSLMQVAKNSCEKFWKICLSVFCDWKFHSRVSCNGSRQAFWVNLATRASTHETVANLSRDKPQNPGFWKFLRLFRDWVPDLPESRRSFWVSLRLEARDWIDSWDWVVRTKLHSFWNFSKTKQLSKNN